MWEATLKPDVISYSAAISACEKRDQWQHALALLGEMRVAKLEPDSATTLGSARARRASSGSGLWRCFARCGRRSWSKTSSTYSAGISACEKGEQWQRALTLLREMCEAKVESNVISYGAGITACEKGRQWQHAVSLLHDMWNAMLGTRAISYNAGIGAVPAHYAAIRVCEVSGQWAKALDLLESMLGARVDTAAAKNPDAGRYLHVFQAGGPMDVFKHVILVALLQQMTSDVDPFTFIDTHAGAGVYDLNSEESLRRRRFEEGVLRLSRAADSCGRGLVADYLDAVRSCNQALGAPQRAMGIYPGSPALAWQWLRPQDSAVFFEAAAEPYESLRRSVALLGRDADRRPVLLRDDSYLRIALGHLPWPSGRQLVLIDPPYDSVQSHATWNVYIIRRLLQRSPSTCVALWYPLVDEEQVASLHGQVRSLAGRSVLVAEMRLENSLPGGSALQGSGMLIVNPPPAVHAQLLAALPGLGRALRAPDYRVLWL
ncbi:unnamed protein product [Prorocentrum cordatum]|uniref:Uncharacterized protein n=1 Tax=Prorocentrum cordatum TaxID=2364126 RepID=A0ABN9UH74_9DINO|nr:unnamed protein product [Polarella glacialis]